MQEENLANKNAIKILKKTTNLDKDTLKNIKKIYKKDTKNGYGINNIVWKSKLKDLIAIKRNNN